MSSPEHASENVEITSIEQAMGYFAQWHARILHQLNYALNAPDNVEIRFAADGKEDIVLSTDQRKGFNAGLITAIGIVGELPFAYQVEGTEIDDLVDQGPEVLEQTPEGEPV